MIHTVDTCKIQNSNVGNFPLWTPIAVRFAASAEWVLGIIADSKQYGECFFAFLPGYSCLQAKSNEIVEWKHADIRITVLPHSGDVK